MNDVLSVLKKSGFNFNKRFGQNFIVDPNLLNSIIKKSDISKEDTVLEIGVGAGTLTRAISYNAKKVIGYEIDLNLKPVLNETLKDLDNIEIRFKDVLKDSIKDIEDGIGEDYVLIANLPYYITSELILLFTQKAKHCKKIVIMIQKEVAERLIAKEGTSEYGCLTLAVNAMYNVRIIEEVNRKMFIPSPNVDSSVVLMEKDSTKYNIKDYDTYNRVIRSAFSMRRKTLINNLTKSFNISRDECCEILNNYLQNNNDVRGEALSVSDFVILSNIFFDRKIIHG